MNSIDFSEPPEDLQRGTRLGRYELLLRIGRGGMATVWVARERGPTRQQDRLVAVKAILSDLATDQAFIKMFLDEGRIVRLIRHENVVDVYEVDEDRGVMFMVMEWVEGDSLHAVIAEAGRRRPIPPEMAVRIIADAAAGLHAAHELKDEQGQSMEVVHRDVSPHNILIGLDGMIKLVDFGVARAMGRASEVTSAGQLKGKFGYMSPEQAMAKKVDRRSDVFALGIVLFELTTGRRLFRGQHEAETLHLVVSGPIPAPTSFDPRYPAALEQIVLRALERDPKKRFQSALELHHALGAYLKSERVVVPRAGIAGLLKKVLGPRVEQRRKAIRAAMRAIDGDAPAGVNVPPSDPLAASPPESTATGVSAVSGASSVSQVSAPSQPSQLSGPSSVSTPAHHTQPTFTSSGTRPLGAYESGGMSQFSAASQLSYGGPQVVVRRGGLLGYVIGVFGLAVALGVALFFVLRPPERPTTIVNVTPTAPAPAAPTTPPAPTTEVQGAVPLPLAPEPTPPEAGAPKAVKPGPRPAAPRPAPRPAPKQVTPAPPRQNPYE